MAKRNKAEIGTRKANAEVSTRIEAANEICPGTCDAPEPKAKNK